MGIKVIHHKDDLFGIGVQVVHKIPDFLCPVCGCTVFTCAHMVNASERLHKSKNTDDAVADIFRIGFQVASGNHWQRLPDFSQKLVRFLIHTHNWMLFIIGEFIHIKDILHAGYEFWSFFCWDAPVVVFVRSKFVFFKLCGLLPCRQEFPELLCIQFCFYKMDVIFFWSCHRNHRRFFYYTSEQLRLLGMFG